ncbi:hypothetical protein F2Q69_00028733 [Brassica cretica]|uniref:Uncharacterized protein n=2 Tax=Brassica cretica TaxID=69181 RepID=A0A8S9S7Y9_BRACR|nr:hypothetical protein F2Q69_00028733 [Brassica cretica]KAF3611477.1 hypothetical protein DY000_02047780 [Brassica cretica]
MGKLELLEYFNEYPAIRSRHSYALGGLFELRQIRGGVILLALNAVKSCSALCRPLLRVGDAIIGMSLENFGNYRVEMAIADDTAEGTFVWFDGVMTKLHSLRASEAVQMLAEDGVNPEDSRIPPFIADMEGKSYTFQVRVTVFNFTEHHKMLTITHIVEELGRVPVDDMEDNGGDKDDDDDIPPGKPMPDEFGSGGAIGDSSSNADTGTVGIARTMTMTDVASSKVVKKARVG